MLVLRFQCQVNKGGRPVEPSSRIGVNFCPDGAVHRDDVLHHQPQESRFPEYVGLLHCGFVLRLCRLPVRLVLLEGQKLGEGFCDGCFGIEHLESPNVGCTGQLGFALLSRVTRHTVSRLACIPGTARCCSLVLPQHSRTTKILHWEANGTRASLNGGGVIVHTSGGRPLMMLYAIRRLLKPTLAGFSNFDGTASSSRRAPRRTPAQPAQHRPANHSAAIPDVPEIPDQNTQVKRSPARKDSFVDAQIAEQHSLTS